MREITYRDMCDYLWLMAEQICFIPPGEKSGRWTREDRVMLIYSALCALNKIPLAERKRTGQL